MRTLTFPDLGTHFTLILALVTLLLASARITRLLVADEYPPSIWLRIRWDTVTKDGPWALLAHCPWCLGPYVSGLSALWAYLSNLHWTWWVVNGFFALGYVTSWIVFHDEDGAPST
jgi:hypothetical protein